MARLTKGAFLHAVDAIHQQIGSAISEWSILEEALFQIYVRALDPAGSATYAHAKIFHSITGFDQRLMMIDEALAGTPLVVSLGIDNMEDWKILRQQVRGLNLLRNKLAHGSIADPEMNFSRTKDFAALVWVPFYERTTYFEWKASGGNVRGKRSRYQELTLADIAGIRGQFAEGTRRVARYVEIYYPANAKTP